MFVVCLGFVAPSEAQYYPSTYYGGGYYGTGSYGGAYGGGYYGGGVYGGGYYGGGAYGGGAYGGGYPGSSYGGGVYGGGYPGSSYGGFGGGYSMHPGSSPYGYNGFTIPLYNQFMYQIPQPLYQTYAQNYGYSNSMANLARGFWSLSSGFPGLVGSFGLLGGFW